MRPGAKLRLRRRAVIAATIAIINVPQFTRATTKTWSDSNGSWSVATNWGGGVRPFAGDFVVLSKTGNLTCTYDITAAPFNVGSVLIEGNMTLAQGSVLNTRLDVASIVIGSSSAGTYSLAGGTLNATLNTGQTPEIILGQNNGGAGTVVFSAGSISTSALNVGSLGSGSFSQTGGTLAVANMSIGTSSGSGFYQLNGGALNASGTVTLGANGSFTSNGTGSLSNTTTFVLAGGAASGTINNNGTFISNSGTLAGAGAGTMLVSNGTFIYNGGDDSAWQLKNFGFVTINNNWSINSLINQSVQAFTIPSGITVNLTTVASNDRALSNDGTIVLNGGVLNSTGATVSQITGDGAKGTFSHLAGTNNVSNLYLGNGTTSNGSYTLTSGTLNVTNYEAIGYFGNGTLIQSTGTHTTPRLQLGVQTGSHGTLSISGGTLNIAASGLTMFVGLDGSGTLDQKGGVVTADQMSVAENAGSSGTYLLEGGTLSTSGEIIADDASTASFQQSGGFHTVPALTLADFSPNAHGSYLLTGGTLNTVQEVIGSTGAGTFTQLGGSHSLSGPMLLAPGASSSGTYALGGGTLSATAIDIGTNGQFIQTSGVLNVGSILVHGINMRYSFQNGLLHLTSATLANALNVTGSGLLGSSITTLPDRSIIDDGFVDLLPLGQITVNGGTFTAGTLFNDGGNIQLNSGTLQINSPAIHIGSNTPLGSAVALNLGANLIAGGSNNISVDGLSILDLRGGMVSSAAGITNNGQIFMESPDSFVTGSGSLVNNGLINGTGRVLLPLFNNAEVRADAGDDLQFQGFGNVITNTGKFTLNGGRIEFSQDLTNGGTGIISGRGTLATTLGFSNNGSVVFSGAGNTDVYGPVTNFNRINITGGNTTTFWNNVATTSGTISVNTNSTVVFAGNLTGQTHLTGPGVKDFEGTASGGAIASIVGDTVVEDTASVSADFVHEDDVQVYGSLQVTPNSPAHVSQINTLSSVSGTFDLTNNHLIVTNTPLVSIAADITSAYNNGAWTGTGLTSSHAAATAADPLNPHKTALGYGTAGSLGLNTFDGISVSPSTVLVRYTYSGDANLDGIVNALDFNALATSFGANPGSDVWTQGDFNYDGQVNTQDFMALATNFSQSLPSAPVAGSLVPEPCVLGLALLPSALIVRRRSGRRRSQ